MSAKIETGLQYSEQPLPAGMAEVFRNARDGLTWLHLARDCGCFNYPRRRGLHSNDQEADVYLRLTKWTIMIT